VLKVLSKFSNCVKSPTYFFGWVESTSNADVFKEEVLFHIVDGIHRKKHVLTNPPRKRMVWVYDFDHKLWLGMVPSC